MALDIQLASAWEGLFPLGRSHADRDTRSLADINRGKRIAVSQYLWFPPKMDKGALFMFIEIKCVSAPLFSDFDFTTVVGNVTMYSDFGSKRV